VIWVVGHGTGPLWKCLAIILAAAPGVLLGACSSSGSSTASTATQPAPALMPVTIRITLDHTRVVAGTAIKGEAVLTNTTSKAITVESCAADGWFEVGLVNSNVGFDPANPLIVCRPSVQLSPGPNRFPLTVVTTYQGCAQLGGSATTDDPPCATDGLPPLPVGSYSTKVITSGLPAGTPSPPRIPVRLLSNQG
jgi:hypothetical protein